MTQPMKRLGRALPHVAWRDAQLSALEAQNEQLVRAMERRGAGPERWVPPAHAAAIVLVRESGMFDRDWYLSQVEEDLASEDECIEHYLRHGAAAEFSPHPAFVAAWYVEQVRAAGGYATLRKIASAPLLHYLAVGARRLLSPHPGFDPAAYVRENPDAASEPFGPLAHFLRAGNLEGAAVEGDEHRGLPPAQRRTADEFLASARAASEVLRDSHGHGHLERDRPDFDREAEAALKKSLLAEGVGPAQPTVTVVLPTKDRASVVVAAVASVVEQSYAGWQLVIVDDGSRDGTAEALAGFLDDPRVTFVRHEESRGVAAARNTALEHARGDYIAYLDSDNTWYPDFLELMVIYLTRHGHRAAYAMSSLTEQGGKGRVLYRGMPFSRTALKERNYIDCIVLVHERALLDSTGGFDERLRRNVDWDLFIRLVDTCDFGFLPIIATDYDLWESRTDRITTEEPSSYRYLVRQRAMIDWADARSRLETRQSELLSVVLVATESADMVCSTIHRVLATATRDIELVVVDAHMRAGESTRLLMATESLPQVRVHRLAQELPLEVARNVGATLTHGASLVFLAETAWCEPSWDAPLVDALREHCAVQPLTLASGGSVWSAGLDFLPSGHSLMTYQGLAGDAPEVRGTRAVEAVTSACVAFRADHFIHAEGFDALLVNHHAGGELPLRLTRSTGLTSACVGASQVALREHVDQTWKRPARGTARENERFQQAVWQGREATFPRRVHDAGFAVAGVLMDDSPADPGTPLLIHDRAERPLRWAIKIGAPDVSRRESWGDWHFAQALRDSLERCGHQVSIDCHAEWYRPTAYLDDVVLVLRGLSQYDVNPLHTNVSWVISHPDRASAGELESYDLVFGASARWCERVSRRLQRPAEVLLQCTDHRRFHPVPPDTRRQHPILAVANARGLKAKELRPAIAAVLAAGLTPAVYGERWDGLLSEEVWQGVYIPNDELASVYVAAGVVLNDHWDDMREQGLLSNRLFDLTACNAKVLSDHLPEIEDVFGDVVLTYTRPDEISALVSTHLNESEERRTAREALGERVRREHTFDARARLLSERVAAMRSTSLGG